MGELLHTSHIKLVQQKGSERDAFIEHFPEPVRYGLHTAVAKFYGAEPDTEYPTTLDHVIAAAGG